MELFGFKKPKWESNDPKERLTGIQELGEQDAELLEKIAVEDEEKDIRHIALGKINELPALERLVVQLQDAELKDIALAKINKIYAESLVSAQALTPAEETLLTKINDPEVLSDVAVRAVSTDIRLTAIASIDNENLLSSIVEQRCGKEPACAALEKIEDAGLLKHLAEKASNKTARTLATEKLAAVQTKGQNSAQKNDPENELAKLLKEAEALADSNQWDFAVSRLEEIQGIWLQHDPQGKHPHKTSLDDACSLFTDRRDEFDRRRENERRKADEFSSKVKMLEEICTEIENLTGSIAEDVVDHFRAATVKWPESSKIPKIEPFTSLSARFSRARHSFQEVQEQIVSERNRFTEIGDDLDRLERKIRDKEWQQAKIPAEQLAKNLDKLHFRFFDAGLLKERLQAIGKQLDERDNELKKSRDLKKQEAITERQRICAELEALIEAEKRSEAEKKVKVLRKKWAALRHFSEKDDNDLINRFNIALERFQERQREFFAQRDWQYWANKNLKEELCQAMESLDEVDDLGYVSENVKDAQAKWKQIGPVAREDAEQLWQRFHTACQRNFERCRPYFADLDQIRAANLERMEAICLEAEALTEATAWEQTAAKLKALQSEWKSFSPLPRRKEIKLYRRFRHACNTFFGRLNEHYDLLNEERLRNLKEKEKLCAKVEDLVADPKPGHGKVIRDLQFQWKKIGAVPRSEGKAVWKRFRKACDQFFEWLDEYRLQNFQLKEKLCEQVEEIVASVNKESDRREVAATLTELQRKWKEIGPVPQAKKEEIWQRFNKPCNEFFQARRERFKKIDEERLENLKKKMEMLQKAEELGVSANSKEVAEQLSHLQEQWRETGPAPREEDSSLNEQFKASCDAFFEGRHQFFENLQQDRFENQKRKEALCFQLEKILGIDPPIQDSKNDKKALTLADEIKLALEINFALRGMGDDRRRKSDEVRRMQQEWKKIGPVPQDQEQLLWGRFRRALDVFFEKEPQKSGK